MRKLLFVTALLALATACPKVERKVYTFDLKAKTGGVRFENVFTDSPDTAVGDFLDVVNQVVRGTKLEEDHPGWRIGEKALFENEGRLDGRVAFTFDDARGAGLYQHDKKSPWIWCASREEEEVIVTTNGTRLDDVLPGCVAWDRKATQLEVTVRTATLSGGEKSLIDPYRRWAAGEELVAEATDATDMNALSGLFGGLAVDPGFAGSPLAPWDLTVGPASDPEVDLTPAADALKLCLVSEASTNGGVVTDRVVVNVKAGGAAWTSTTDDGSVRMLDCVGAALAALTPPARKADWSFSFPIAAKAKAP